MEQPVTQLPPPSIDEINFHQEYNIAAGHVRKDLFSDILYQHAIIMVDAAVGRDAMEFVQLGERLNQVQSNWIDLLCCGINNTTQSELDKQYRKTVRNVIVKFTHQLLDMLINEKEVTVDELSSAGDFHVQVAAHAELPLQRTKMLFLTYIVDMKNMYKTNTLSGYHRAAVACLNSAFQLGFWLDCTIFR